MTDWIVLVVIPVCVMWIQICSWELQARAAAAARARDMRALEARLAGLEAQLRSILTQLDDAGDVRVTWR